MPHIGAGERVAITGIGSYLPRRSHTNDTLPPLEQPLTDAQLARVGVRRRGWADESEGVAEMAAAAARHALENACTAPQELDLIILANWTGRRYIPEFAPRVKQLIAATDAVAFDVCCACAGFLYGLAIAHGFLRGPRVRTALVVASETTSSRARPGSKATLVFGDGAGAFVLDRRATRGGELLDYELLTDGDNHAIMEVTPAGHVRTHLDQRSLVDLAARSLERVITRLLARNDLKLDDVDWIIPHSGTAGVQATLRSVLDVPAEKILTNFADVGNVSSASIPVALDHFVRSGTVKPGDLVVSAAVGTGWYAASALYTV